MRRERVVERDVEAPAQRFGDPHEHALEFVRNRWVKQEPRREVGIAQAPKESRGPLRRNERGLALELLAHLRRVKLSVRLRLEELHARAKQRVAHQVQPQLVVELTRLHREHVVVVVVGRAGVRTRRHPRVARRLLSCYCLHCACGRALLGVRVK